MSCKRVKPATLPISALGGSLIIAMLGSWAVARPQRARMAVEPPASADPASRAVPSARRDLPDRLAGVRPLPPLRHPAAKGLRDPFEPPRTRLESTDDLRAGPLPPGRRGLIINQLRLEGIAREEASHTMIAVVANNSNLAYFLRQKEAVYNGVVTRITSDAIYFNENARDVNGRVRTREVVLRLKTTPGGPR